MALTATNPAGLEEALNTNFFLKGDEPTSVDASIFTELTQSPPNSQQFPHLWSWFCFINQFAPKVRSSWPAPPEPAAQQGEEDDFDLFAQDAEAEQAAKKVQEDLAQNKPKGPPVGKSNVIFGVKPRYTSVDLDSLADRIKVEVQLEGLKWTEEYKKQPVAFGIELLAIGCVVTDDVETEVIIDTIKAMKGDMEIDVEDDEGEPTGEKEWVFEKLAQSVDILVFQKI